MPDGIRELGKDRFSYGGANTRLHHIRSLSGCVLLEGKEGKESYESQLQDDGLTRGGRQVTLAEQNRR